MPEESQTSNHDRLLFHRSLILWSHIVLGSVAALMFLSTVDLRHFAYWRRGAAVGVLMISSAATIPYFLFGFLSYRAVSYRRIGLWVYISLLVAGTVGVGCWYLSDLREQNGPAGTVIVLLAQSFLYFNAFALCFARRRSP